MRWLAPLLPGDGAVQRGGRRSPTPRRRSTSRCKYAVAHFLLHTLVLLSSIVVWMPILSPLPEVPRLFPPLAMFYLFLQSVVPTVPASFLTFGKTPLYHVYATFPRLWGIDALDRHAGRGAHHEDRRRHRAVGRRSLSCSSGGSAAKRPSPGPQSTSRELDRELIRLGMTQS